MNNRQYNLSFRTLPSHLLLSLTALYLAMVHAICVWLIFYSEITFIENICFKFTRAEKLKCLLLPALSSKELNLQLELSFHIRAPQLLNSEM